MELKHDPGSAALIGEFKQDLKVKNYSKDTIDARFRQSVQFLVWMERILNKRVKDIVEEDILTYQRYLEQKGVSANTVHSYLHSIKRFFIWLEEKLYILINPYEKLTLHKPIAKIPLTLSEKEAKKILEKPNTQTLLGVRDRAILELLYSTGVRLNELYHLSIFDIDTESGFLRINQGKGGKDRFTPLTKPACFYLREYIQKVRPQLVKGKLQEIALFLGLSGRRLSDQILSKLVRAYAQKAGIKKRVTVHTFRHTLATHLLDNDVDIFKIQQLLGHSRVSVTQKYTRVTQKQVKQTHKNHHPREKEKDQ